DDDLLLGRPQNLVQPRIETEEFGRVVEACHHVFEWVVVAENAILVPPDYRLSAGSCTGLALAHRFPRFLPLPSHTLARACSSSSRPDSQCTSSRATSGSPASAGHRSRSFAASFPVMTTKST